MARVGRLVLWPKTEAELAAVIVHWLTELKWDVYQEVQLHRGSAVADIVAVQNRIVWVVETKRALTLDVLEQALGWYHYAHYISVGVPHGKHRAKSLWDNGLIRDIFQWKHVGALMAHQDGTVLETIHPHLNRRALAHKFRAAVTPEHKTFSAAGAAHSAHWSPFQATCQQVREYVEKHPGATLMETMNNVKHHYASTSTARSCLAKWGEKGIIKGVEFRMEGKAWKLYPKKVIDNGNSAR